MTSKATPSRAGSPRARDRKGTGIRQRATRKPLVLTKAKARRLALEYVSKVAFLDEALASALDFASHDAIVLLAQGKRSPRAESVAELWVGPSGARRLLAAQLALATGPLASNFPGENHDE